MKCKTLPIDTVGGLVIWQGVAYDILVASSLLVISVVDWARSLRERYSEEIEDSKAECVDYRDSESALHEVTEWLVNPSEQVLSHPGFLRRQSIAPVFVNRANFAEYMNCLLKVAFKVDIVHRESECLRPEFQFVFVADGERRIYGTRTLRVPLRYTGNLADGILVDADQISAQGLAAYRRWVCAPSACKYLEEVPSL